MSARRKSRGGSVEPEMNVTPLVDVVLVLLIIFMVITPQMEAGPSVDLPGIVHVDPKSNAQLEPLLVSVDRGGKIFLDKDGFEREALMSELKRLREETPGRRVILRADSEVAYVDVRRLFRSVQEIGFSGVSLQVGEIQEPEKQDAPSSANRKRG